MHPLSASELLDVWERGRNLSPVHQAILILLTACPEMSEKAILELNIGKRDQYLLVLHEWIFGSRFIGLASCPACGEQLELNFSTEDIIENSEANFENLRKELKNNADKYLVINADNELRINTDNELRINTDNELRINTDNYDISFRLPNSQDLLSIANCEDYERNYRDNSGNISSAKQQLIERCLIETKYEGKEIPAKQIPEFILETVSRYMTELDPITDMELELTCPACTCVWNAIFDIVSYFWTEINAWAYRILAEVHIIASVYGWKEADILAMSPWRRQIYLEMIGK